MRNALDSKPEPQTTFRSIIGPFPKEVGREKREEQQRAHERQQPRGREEHRRHRQQAQEAEKQKQDEDAVKQLLRKKRDVELIQEQRRLAERQKDKDLEKLVKRIAQLLKEGIAEPAHARQHEAKKEGIRPKREAEAAHWKKKDLKEEGGYKARDAHEQRKQREQIHAGDGHVRQHHAKDVDERERVRRRSRERHEQVRCVDEHRKEPERRQNADREFQDVQNNGVLKDKARQGKHIREVYMARDEKRQKNREHRYRDPDYLIAVALGLPACKLVFPPGSIDKGQITYDHVAGKAAKTWKCSINKTQSKVGRPICLDGYSTGSIVTFGERYRCNVCGSSRCNIPEHHFAGA